MSFTTTFQIEKPDYKTLRFDSACNETFDKLDDALKCWPSANEPGNALNYDEIVLTEGILWRDTTNHLLKVYGAAAWEEIITNAGKSGGLTFPGGKAASEALTLQSTVHATKGKIIFGSLSVYDEVNDRFGISVTTPSYSLSIGGNATRTVGMERHTTANTAGNSLTIQSGGATSGATDKNGGDVIVKSGLSTGTGESGIQIQGCVAGSTGVSDNSYSTVIQVLGNKLAFFAGTPGAKPEVTGSKGSNAALESLIDALEGLGLLTDSTT